MITKEKYSRSSYKYGRTMEDNGHEWLWLSHEEYDTKEETEQAIAETAEPSVFMVYRVHIYTEICLAD